MFRKTFFGFLAAFGLAGSVHAATISDPAAQVFYDPGVPSIIAISNNPVATPPVSPVPVFAFLIDTTGNSIDLTVEDSSLNTILSATGTGFTATAGGITAILQTTSDLTGMFGPSLLVSLNIANFDPAAFFNGTGELVIESAPAPVPLPAAAPLLVGGLALLWGTRKARRCLT